MVNQQNQLYERVLRVTHVYLGPAADRFISRQVQNHLHKDPELIDEEDLSNLIDWIRVGVSLMTDDNEIVEEYIDQLKNLSLPSKKSKRKGQEA